MEAKKVPMREILVYSFGLFGFQAIVGFLNSYQAQFYNSTMSANLTIIGVIMLIAKLISSFADPIIGNIIDKSNFKAGKLRPFILFSAIPFIILTVVIFIVVPFKGAALYIYIFITFTLWSMAMTFADIPSQGMLSVLSDDSNERSKIAGISNLLKNVGLSSSFLIVLIVCIVTGTGSGKISKLDFLISALVMAVIGGTLFLLIYFVNKERVKFKPSGSSMKEMVHTLKNNKPLMLILLSTLLGFGRTMQMSIQAQAADALIGQVTIFGYTIGGENTIMILGIAAGIGALISLSLMPIFSKKWGEKQTFIWVSVFGFVAGVVVFLLYAFGLVNNVYILNLCLFFTMLSAGVVTFFPLIMVADCVEYYEWKTGKRTEGVHYAVLSFSIKISNALSVAGGIMIVGLSGYKAVDFTFSFKTKVIIFVAYVLVPGICYLLAALPMLKYPLSGSEKEKIMRELKERREEAQ